MNKENKYTSKEDKIIIAKRERAYNYFMGNEFDTAYAYMQYMLVVNQSKEYAEKVLHTTLAD